MEASDCAKRVGCAINRHLRDNDPQTGMAELWRRMTDIQGGQHKDQGQADDLNITAYDLNNHYASISTDPSYTAPALKLTAASGWWLSMSRRSFIHSIIFVIQQKDETASPRGFYASPLSPMLLHLLTYAVSLSLLVSYVPKQRKIATIQLVTKIKNPTTL